MSEIQDIEKRDMEVVRRKTDNGRYVVEYQENDGFATSREYFDEKIEAIREEYSRRKGKNACQKGKCETCPSDIKEKCDFYHEYIEEEAEK